MLLLLEEYYIGGIRLYTGDKGDRVILYSPDTYEEIRKEIKSFYPFLDLLTDREVYLSLQQINLYKHFQL